MIAARRLPRNFADGFIPEAGEHLGEPWMRHADQALEEDALLLAGIEVGRAYGEVEGYQPRPFGCEVGSQFHQRHGSRSPPIMPYGRISQVRFEASAFRS